MSKFAARARSMSSKDKPRAQEVLAWLWKQMNFGWIVFAVLGFPLVIYSFMEARRGVIILEPISAPKSFADSGLTSEVLTRRVREQMQEIERTDEEASPKAQLSMESDHELPDIEIPETKVSLQLIRSVLRKLLGNEETHLSGDVFYPDSSGKVEVRASISGSGQSVQTAKARELATSSADELVKGLGEGMMELADPFLLGMYFLQKKDFDAALSVAGRMFYERPGKGHMYSKATVLTGFIADMQDRPTEAVTEIKAAIALDPDWAYPHYALGYIFARQHRPKEAAPEFQQAIDFDPKNADMRASLALVLADLHQQKEAVEQAKRALRLNSTMAYPHMVMGNILHRQGDLAGEASEYRRSIQLDSGNAEAHADLANFLDEQDNPDQAAIEYRRAIQLDPTYAYAHIGLAKVLEEQNNPGEADLEYQRAIVLDPKNAWVHNRYGNLLLHYGGADLAALEFQSAIGLDANYIDPHIGLAKILNARNRPKEAEVELMRAHELERATVASNPNR